jgi:hypothetical protein
MTVEIPEQFEALRKAAVSYACGKRKSCPDLESLQDWFENGDGWDDVVMGNQGGGVYLDSVADKYFSNSMLRDYVDIAPKARITKAQKLAYARERLEYEFRESDDSLHVVQINENPDVYLACLVEGRGQGGWEVFWLGLFRSTEELMDPEKGGDSFYVNQEQISDEMILSKWQA